MPEMSALDRLVAIEAIKHLMGRRCRAVDNRDWETYAACHAEDHKAYTLSDIPTVGRDIMMANLVKAVEGKKSIHHVHSPEITILSPTEAHGIWAMEDRVYWMQGDEEHWVHGWGHYEDTYGLRDGAWVFTSRKLTRQRMEHSPGSNLAG